MSSALQVLSAPLIPHFWALADHDLDMVARCHPCWYPPCNLPPLLIPPGGRRTVTLAILEKKQYRGC